MKLLYTEKNKFWVHCLLMLQCLAKSKRQLNKREKNTGIRVVVKKEIPLSWEAKNQKWCEIFCDRQIPYRLWTHLSSCAKWDVLARSSVRPLTVLTLSCSKLQLEKGKQILDSSHPSVSHHLVTYIFTLLTVLKM